jgi:hypothetical protein
MYLISGTFKQLFKFFRADFMRSSLFLPPSKDKLVIESLYQSFFND